VKSSPSSAASSLELPAAFAADAVAAVLALAAGLFAAWVLQRQGQEGLALAAVAGGLLAGAVQAYGWARARSQPRWDLSGGADGQLWLRRDVMRTPVRVGAATRVLGPSVFLDLHAKDPAIGLQYRGWLTPLDLSPDSLRRLTLVLPECGRDAGS
jgi:hypothetical protein